MLRVPHVSEVTWKGQNQLQKKAGIGDGLRISSSFLVGRILSLKEHK